MIKWPGQRNINVTSSVGQLNWKQTSLKGMWFSAMTTQSIVPTNMSRCLTRVRRVMTRNIFTCYGITAISLTQQVKREKNVYFTWTCAMYKTFLMGLISFNCHDMYISSVNSKYVFCMCVCIKCQVLMSNKFYGVVCNQTPDLFVCVQKYL